MEIKPPGSGKPFFGPSKESRETVKKPDKTFPKKQEVPSTAHQASTNGLSGVTAQFKKKDLEDPKKTESIVGSALDELIRTQFSEMMQIPKSGRKLVADWMANDPIVRSRIVNYLKKVLK